MKKYLRLLCGLLTLCLLAVPVCPAARAADTGRTITLEAGSVDMCTALKDAQDGDTVVLNGNVGITDMTSKDAPWVIDKAVTIQGGNLGLWAGGIILDADVTFRDTTLSFDSNVRNAIMANGHTLTLENVTCSSKSVNLFCGGLYDPEGFGSAPGTAGKIIIKGSTSLKGDDAAGNLYAGNLCMGGMTEADNAVNGPANQYAGSASIQIESGTATLGDIYAGGAQQRIPEGSAAGKVILTDPAKYTTAGSVDVRLTGGTVKYVDGAGAGEVNVTYNGDANSTDLTVKNVSGLRVATGSLAPTAQSGLSESTALSVSKGAKLDLTKLGNVTVGNLEGGGTLLLGRSQSLTVKGSVTGTTTVGIDFLNAGGFSTTPPIAGHPYLHAPSSGSDAFRLAPPEGSDLQFTRADNGDWSVPAGETPVLAKAFQFVEAAASFPIGEPCDLQMEAFDGNGDFMYLDDIPVTILVNGRPTSKQWDDIFDMDVYVSPDNKLSIYLGSDSLSVTAAQEDGTYTIEVVIPGTRTVSGQPLSARTVLTVGEGGTLPPEPLPYQIKSVSASDDQVTVDVSALTADAAPGATVLAAAYTQDGRMHAVSLVPMTAAGTVRVPLDSTGADYVTVFLVDGAGALKPLCRNQTAAK